MKKMWTAVMVVGFIAAVVAIGQEVTSVNAVGFNKIPIGPGKLALVTLNFESFGDASLNDLVGDQLPTGSRAFIWDRSQNPSAYVTALKTRGGWSATNLIYRGDAFWLYNAGTATNSVSFMGEVPYTYNNGATTTVFNITGFDAAGYAYPTDVVWTNTTLSAQMGTGDRIFLWNGNGYDTYLKTRGGWQTPVGLTIPAGSAFWVNTTATIDWTEVAPYDL